MSRWQAFRWALVALLVAAPAAAQPPAGANTCLTCHAASTDPRLSAPVTAFSGDDVHRAKGFACVDCHGGDATAADAARAHDRAKGFRGAPRGEAQIAACARCHSDADLMRKYAPGERVDQATEYATSVHGKRLAGGDEKVATCASCHGAHGILAVSNPRSPVYPTNVASTCATCHASADHMAGYTLPDGSPLPTTQFADYERSVHAQALKGGDLSAPTCNDCHGNHGAVPPGVDSIVNVCGTCHAVFAQKFATSVHAFVFDRGCVECHGNHAIAKPTDAMLGTGSGAVCAQCHNGPDDAGATAATTMRRGIDRLEAGIDQSSTLIAGLENAGLEESAQDLALGDARNQLTLARTEMHAFTPATVSAIIDNGMQIVTRVNAAGQDGQRELRFRRRGLAVSLGLILLFVVALALKIRQIDRRRGA